MSANVCTNETSKPCFHFVSVSQLAMRLCLTYHEYKYCTVFFSAYYSKGGSQLFFLLFFF